MSATHSARRASGDWDLQHQGSNTLTADILSYFWHPVRASNFDGIDDPVFTDLLDKARHSLDEERRRANETLVRVAPRVADSLSRGGCKQRGAKGRIWSRYRGSTIVGRGRKYDDQCWAGSAVSHPA